LRTKKFKKSWVSSPPIFKHLSKLPEQKKRKMSTRRKAEAGSAISSDAHPYFPYSLMGG
jgi:hypothetical protein